MPSDWVKFRFKSFWPDGPVISLPAVGHYLQEDAPETVGALVDQFIQINNPPGRGFRSGPGTERHQPLGERLRRNVKHAGSNK